MNKGGVISSNKRARDTSADIARKTTLRPFTVPHLRKWCSALVLDNGEPWILEPFQYRFAADIFAGFLENWLIVPEGNAKTTLAGGLVLYHAQFLPNARVPVAASSRDQAEWLYQAAAGLVERSPSIEKLFRCQEGYRRIRCDDMGSRIQIFASDDRTGDGIVPTLCVLEELHRHRNLSLYRTWQGKLVKRGAQLLAISTAGEPDGEFETTRKRIKDNASRSDHRGFYLRAVSGNGKTVLHEYAVPEEGDPDNMAQVKKANPLKAITIEKLREKHPPECDTTTPSHWRRFVCGMPNRLESWIDVPKDWDPLAVDIGGVEDGDEVWIAVRAGAGMGIGIAAPKPDGAVATRAELAPPPPSGRYRLDQVEFALRRLAERYVVHEIAYDPAQFERPAELLAAEGLPMVEVPQRPMRLAQATATMWRLISAKLLRHDGSDELRTQVSLGQTKETVQGWYLIPSAQTAGLIAVAMAVHRASELGQSRDVLFA